MKTEKNVGLIPAFVLSSIMTSYPDSNFSENVQILLEDEDLIRKLSEMKEGKWKSLVNDLLEISSNSERVENLGSEYIDTFDRGRQANPLYETEYGRSRSLVKGNELADIAGFYNAFGFEIGKEGTLPEMVDHLAVELEFYSLMLMKNQTLVDNEDHAGVEIVQDAQKKFLGAHLGRFVGAICQRPGVQSSSFYSQALSLVNELVQQECERLGVQVDPVDWIGGQEISGEMSCGGLSCSKPS